MLTQQLTQYLHLGRTLRNTQKWLTKDCVVYSQSTDQFSFTEQALIMCTQSLHVACNTAKNWVEHDQ